MQLHIEIKSFSKPYSISKYQIIVRKELLLLQITKKHGGILVTNDDSLSYEGINIDILPPLFYTDAEIVSDKGFYSVPMIINGKKVNLIVGIDSNIVIK